MQANRQLLAISRPSVQLVQMDITDQETGGGTVVNPDFKLSELYGDSAPMVMIRNYRIPEKDISSLELDCMGFLPVLNMSIRERGGVFKSAFFPKDGDVISLYIKSPVNQLKPIRADFLVISVDPTAAMDPDSESGRFRIRAVLNIPGFLTPDLLSYQGTSNDVLARLASDFNLGFATNEPTTNDFMKWVCHMITPQDFAKDILSRSYRDDESFFRGWVDVHYQMCMVNMDPMFVLDEELITAYDSFLGETNYLPTDNEAGSTLEMPLFLSNHSSVHGTRQHIISYSIFQQNNNIKQGYGEEIVFFDRELDDIVSAEVSLLRTQDSALFLEGSDSYGVNNHKQIGYYGDNPHTSNGHPNFVYAEVHNRINNSHVGRMGLKVQLPQYNPNLYKGQVVPIFILNKNSLVRASMTSDDATGDIPDSGSLDEFLSGFYFVTGWKIKYRAARGTFVHELHLIKRDWKFLEQV